MQCSVLTHCGGALRQDAPFRSDGCPAQAFKPDGPRNWLLAVAVVDQHSPVDAQCFCRLLQCLPRVVQPGPDALMSDVARLLEREVAQVAV